MLWESNLFRIGTNKLCVTLNPVDYSEWACPVVKIAKQNITVHICGDFRAIVNPCTENDNNSFPIMEELSAKLASVKFFTIFDLKDVYLELLLYNETRKLLTINTHKGLIYCVKIIVLSKICTWNVSEKNRKHSFKNDYVVLFLHRYANLLIKISSLYNL